MMYATGMYKPHFRTAMTFLILSLRSYLNHGTNAAEYQANARSVAFAQLQYTGYTVSESNENYSISLSLTTEKYNKSC